MYLWNPSQTKWKPYHSALVRVGVPSSALVRVGVPSSALVRVGGSPSPNRIILGV